MEWDREREDGELKEMKKREEEEKREAAAAGGAVGPSRFLPTNWQTQAGPRNDVRVV
jgi:membrane-bound lytic murein transglycosylase B